MEDSVLSVGRQKEDRVSVLSVGRKIELVCYQ